MQFFHLPTEIIRLILSNLNKNDTNNLCQVSKASYDRVAPILYHSVVLKHGDFHASRSITAFLERPERSQVLHYITELCVTCDFESENETTYHTTNPAPDISDLLRLLKNGQLRTFSWHLGTCIPRDIFRSSGYLNLHQKNIRSISLITHTRRSTDCVKNGNPLYFGGFEALESLSWIGIRNPEDTSELRSSLAHLCGQLINLHLDAVYITLPRVYGRSVPDITLFDQQLARLETLSLGAFPIGSRELIQSFNVRQLRSLKLRSCHWCDDFFRYLSEDKQSVNLKCFEFQCPESIEVGEEKIVSKFLKSFTGLEELYLSFAGAIDPLPLWSAALHHSSSLRGMVYQIRGPAPEEFDLPRHMEVDLYDMHIVHQRNWSVLRNCLGALELQWLGLCCSLFYLQPLVEPYRTKDTLKVLHIRQSGRDIRRRGSMWFSTTEPIQNRSETSLLKLMNPVSRDFIYWVFGPSGIHSLQLLAFGDFSSGGRFSSHNLILCRRDLVTDGGLPCRLLDPDLERARGVLLSSAIWSFLEACPTDPLSFPYYEDVWNDPTEEQMFLDDYSEDDEFYEDDEDDDDDDDDEDDDDDYSDEDYKYDIGEMINRIQRAGFY
ncbi:hypothetical protein GGR51DRAFT_317949 [Nemania sp. FL0031]|nr:hypothetical protein GGR51DRAFT_317949 [Nemania sp. FL0031]